MPESSLNQILADNLALHMEKKGLKQMALAKKCGVGQTTISLFLRPDRRMPGKDG
jgi:transcriptional regulator with XRE-family HTH domain